MRFGCGQKTQLNASSSATAALPVFYFANWEGRRRRTGRIQLGFLPAAETHEGNFSTLGKALVDPTSNNVPFPGNQIPKSRWDPITTKLLPLIPVPNYINIRPGINYITTPAPTAKERRDQVTSRIDWVVSSKGSFFARYSLADDVLGDPEYIPNKGMNRPDNTHHLAIGYTHLHNANLITESRLGFTRAFLARVPDGDATSKNYVAELGL